MAKVVDFGKARNESIEKKKRSFERVLFQEFLGAFAEIDNQGTKYDVNIIDISRSGVQFQVPYSKNNYHHFKVDQDVTLRIYFTKDDFLPMVVSIKRTSEYVDQKGDVFLRVGGEFDKTIPSFKAFEPFIEFIYKFAEFSCVDKGESKVYFL